MANRKMSLSKDGKEILDLAAAELEMDRAKVISLALAKGLSSSKTIIVDASSTPKWIVPEGIIRNEEFLLFKHLITMKQGKSLEDEELHKQIIFHLEKGLRLLKTAFTEKNTLEHSILSVLN